MNYTLRFMETRCLFQDAELDDLATKLRHAIARNPERSQVERVELEDLKRWVAIRQTRDSSDSEPYL